MHFSHKDSKFLCRLLLTKVLIKSATERALNSNGTDRTSSPPLYGVLYGHNALYKYGFFKESNDI